MQAPRTPTNLNAQLSKTTAGVDLTWQDNASNETGFVIERSADGGKTYDVAIDLGPNNKTGNVSYTDSTVVLGKTYTYRVKAMNGGTSSGYSNTKTISVQVPAVPAGLNAFSRLRGFTASWNNVSNATGYIVQYATDGAFSKNVVNKPVNTNYFTETGLPRRTTYYVRVQATNFFGPSAWTTTKSVRTQ